MNSDFKELLTILNACQVSYLVVGGYAYIYYAEPRYTKDIDLWILPSLENAIRLRQALLQFGGWVEGMTLEHFTTERTMFQIGLPPCRVDFLTSIPGLEFDSAYAARKVADIDGLAIPLIALPDLITAKRASGREQDLRDVAGLERITGE
jgi:predicted nucleotidyltransferase